MKYFCLILLTVAFLIPVQAQQLRVAAAANLQDVIKVLQADFNKRTGINAEIIVGSSGKLVAQISNGAPYDVFLSADMQFADALFEDGMATAAPKIYASGSLIVCSKTKRSFGNLEKLLLSPVVKHIAIANPDVAPYGKAAKEALTKVGLFEKVKDKIVYGESIAQVNTYIATGVADIGFTAESFLKELPADKKLYGQAISPNYYTPISQGMVLLKRAENNTAAQKFYQYILSAAAKRIFKKFGYIV